PRVDGWLIERSDSRFSSCLRNALTYNHHGRHQSARNNGLNENGAGIYNAGRFELDHCTMVSNFCELHLTRFIKGEENKKEEAKRGHSLGRRTGFVALGSSRPPYASMT